MPTKSKRVKAAIRRMCEGWMAGTWRKPIRNGKDPQWVTWTGSEWEIVPERAAAVRRAIGLFMAGHGHTRIQDTLRNEGLQCTELGGNSQQVYRTIRNRALIGEKTIEVDGEEYRLTGYYPPILTEADFMDLQARMAARIKEKGRESEIPGIFTGIGVARCGYCGAAMVAQNILNRNRKPDGTPMDGHRRLSCAGRGRPEGCPVGGSCSIVPVERAIMTYCADTLNLRALLDGTSREEPLRANLAKHRQAIAELERQMEKITEVLLAADDDGATPLVFVRKARELEHALATERAAEQSAELALMSVATRTSPALSEAWAALVKGVEAMDPDARLKARQLMRDTFETIVVYHRGFVPDDWDGKTIDLVLVAKGGNTRQLSINKRTGAWQAEVNTTVIP